MTAPEHLVDVNVPELGDGEKKIDVIKIGGVEFEVIEKITTRPGHDIKVPEAELGTGPPILPELGDNDSWCGPDDEKSALRSRARALAARYGMTESEAMLAAERYADYGDPKMNVDAIASAWVGLLEPHWEAIKAGKAVPAWVVALMFSAFKVTRCRIRFKADNYDDIGVYSAVARTWQKEAQEGHEKK